MPDAEIFLRLSTFWNVHEDYVKKYARANKILCVKYDNRIPYNRFRSITSKVDLSQIGGKTDIFKAGQEQGNVISGSGSWHLAWRR